MSDLQLAKILIARMVINEIPPSRQHVVGVRFLDTLQLLLLRQVIVAHGYNYLFAWYVLHYEFQNIMWGRGEVKVDR